MKVDGRTNIVRVLTPREVRYIQAVCGSTKNGRKKVSRNEKWPYS